MTGGNRERFDFWKMAEAARRERDALQRRLKERKAAGPESPERQLIWERENSMLYNMYLEQKAQATAFQKRAEWRERP